METCTTCGGRVAPGFAKHLIDARDVLTVVTDVPADVCKQCGRVFFGADVVDQLREITNASAAGQVTSTDSVPKVSFTTALAAK